jgi:hypothetical protein
VTAPVFATKWDFLAARVLFGVHPETGQLLLGSEGGTEPIWVCWTDQRLAEHQLMRGYVLRQAPVRQVLPAVPPGTAVRIDPGVPQGMAFDAAMLAELQELCVPFPAGRSADVGTLDPMPREVRDAFGQVTKDHAFVERLWLVRYRIEDGPAQGLAVYDTGVGTEAQESAVAAISRALGAAAPGTVLEELAGVQVMSLDDLPEDIRTWVEEQEPLAAAG